MNSEIKFFEASPVGEDFHRHEKALELCSAISINEMFLLNHGDFSYELLVELAAEQNCVVIEIHLDPFNIQ